MATIEEGDEVQFLQDPENVVYEVTHVNNNYTVDLYPGDGFTTTIEYVPVRLLKPAPVPIRDGSLWKVKETGSRVFVTIGGGTFVTYVRAGSTETLTVGADWFRENMEKLNG